MCRSAGRYATILLFKAHLWGEIASRAVGAHRGICGARAAFAGTGQAGVAPDRPAATGFRIPPLRQHALVRNAPHQIVRVCRRFTHCQQKQQKCQRSRESLHGSGHGCIMRAIACTFQPGLLLAFSRPGRRHLLTHQTGGRKSSCPGLRDCGQAEGCVFYVPAGAGHQRCASIERDRSGAWPCRSGSSE